MYQFTDPGMTEFSLGEFDLVSNQNQPFEVKNSKLANALLSRGIIKAAAEIGKEVVKKEVEKVIDKVVEKVTK